ncbi:MAG TPA: YihY/virulence factor BrkB family protein [Pyrinomonadaceae bacterium]|jgi:membrane protein
MNWEKIKKFFVRLYKKVNDDDILGNAAQVAFYFTFALFPLLLFLISLFGIILNSTDDLRGELFVYLRQIMPGSAFTLIETTLQEVAENTSGSKLTIGILITLWSASAGIDNLRGALNEVYNLKENRSWWKTKLLAVLLTLGIGVLIFVAIVSVFYGTHLLDYLLPIDSPYLLMPLRWIIVLVALILTFALLYNFAPNHDAFDWKWITPGAIVGIVLWLLLSGVFRVYLRYFDSYAKTYGSLGAVIILLLWLYLTAMVILIGGAINAIFDEETGVEKENEDPKQVEEEITQTGKEARAN